MEVGFAGQGHAVPRPATVARLDEPEMRREVLTQVGMTGADQAVRAGDREAHEVLIRLAHALDFRLTLGGREEAAMSCDEEGSVFRVRAEAVDVTGLLHRARGIDLLIGDRCVAATTGGQHERRDGDRYDVKRALTQHACQNPYYAS